MKLEHILDNLNSLEKNSFLKIIDTLINENPKNLKQINTILNDIDGGLKTADHYYISKIFDLIENEYLTIVNNELSNSKKQFDILIDILIRDGNCIMSREWFASLYEKEILKIGKKLKEMEKIIKEGSMDIDPKRIRDYEIYQACVHAAYFNDLQNNLDPKITSDEQSIINTLANRIGLSQEEIRLINYTIIPIEKRNIDEIIIDLKNIGIVFYSKKKYQVFIPDKIIRALRRLRGKEIADKHFRRILKQLKDSQINFIVKKHNINWKLNRDEKIDGIINEGISFSGALLFDMHKDGIKVSDVKNILNNLIEKELKLKLPTKGVTAEDKIENLIEYFNQVDKEDKVSISIDGYDQLLIDINDILPRFNKTVKESYELQEENVLKSSYLLDYNMKPRDILYLMKDDELNKICKVKNISTRGNTIENIINNYKDADNIYLENYENIGRRNLAALKENKIKIKESELGAKFEELTKKIFIQLGFNVDEMLKKRLNTLKKKIDIVINLENNEIIIIECKSLKDKDFNKYSSVSRQIKSYIELAEQKGYKVIKSLLIAPEFSDDFEKECDYEYDLNLSLISAATLINILNGFKKIKMQQFPYKLLLRDVVIKEDRILKAIAK